MYNFNHFYYFYITAKSGGVSTAANHLRISQPSLSSQIRILENSLNVKLFRRVGRNNHLTPDGVAIFGICRRMFEVSEEVTDLLSHRLPSASRRLHVGVSDEVDRPFVIEVVNSFLKKQGLLERPKVSVSSGSHQQLVERLRFRELDAIVTQSATTDVDLHSLAKAEVPVALVCSSRWKISAQGKDTDLNSALRAIRGGDTAQWLMPSERFRFRGEIDRFLEKNSRQVRVVFESDVVASLVRSVTDGVGLAFLPLLYVAREIREKSIQVIGARDGYWKYGVWLVGHVQNRNDPVLESFALSFSEICQLAR